MHGGTMGRMHHQELVFAYCIDLPRPIATETVVTAVLALKEDLTLKQDSEPVSPETERLPLRFLIVDDSDLCRKVVMARLRTTYKAICDEAENGAEAVVKIFTAQKEGKVYDCIIMDNTMPVLCGPSATSMIRTFGYTGKMFGATGNVLAAELSHFSAQGLDHVFTKPLKLADYDHMYRSKFV
jgi:CheY-like chemotaxis protein